MASNGSSKDPRETQATPTDSACTTTANRQGERQWHVAGVQLLLDIATQHVVDVLLLPGSHKSGTARWHNTTMAVHASSHLV